MERDFALLTDISEIEISVRTYTWQEPWITLGRFQNPSLDLIQPCTIPYVIRPTGGRAVLHGHDLTIGLAISLLVLAKGDEAAKQRLSRSVRFAYRGAVRPILNSLQSCGIDAVLGEEIKGLAVGPKSADCFAHLSANDAINRKTMKKVCGVAMLLTQDAVLVQASIPIEPPKVDPGLVYRDAAAPSWIELDCQKFSAELEQELARGVLF